jgi:hypothetical protein
LALALCSAAHADGQAQPWAQSRAVGDERLATLRAGVAAPMTQQAGVILWDEPRKAPSPPRQASADNGGGAVLSASVVYRQ